MKRYQGMDPGAAFAVFYEANKDRCLRTVVAGGTDPATAEEAVAEAFARAWAAWPKVSRHPTPVAWVVRVALNHHVSRWRRQRREVSLSDEHTGGLVAHGTDPPGREDLTSALAELPERQRQVVALRIFLDLDTAATADVLGIAEGTVTAHLHRAMTALRALSPKTTEVPR